MRTAVVTSSYPQHPEDPSGHFVRADARRMARLGHEVHVICPGSTWQSIPKDAGVRTWALGGGEAFGWPGLAARVRANPSRLAWVAAYGLRARHRLAQLQPDRVVAHWLVPCGFPISCGAGEWELELVAHGGDVRLLLAMPGPLRNRIVASIVRRAVRVRFAARVILEQLLVALEPGLRSLLASCACVEPPTIEVPDVADRAKRLREEISNRKLATVVGRLVPGKRVDLAIEAVTKLRGLVHLRVIGDGPESAHLAAMAPSSVVSFSGRIPRQEALAWISASDVLIHPSRDEAAPCVVREARLLNTPVVACDCGDLSDWAKSDGGITIVAPIANQLANALCSSLGIQG